VLLNNQLKSTKKSNETNLKYIPPVLFGYIKPEPVLSRLGCIDFKYRYGGYIDLEF